MMLERESFRGRVADPDLRVLIGVLANVEAALLPGVEPAGVVDHLLDRVRRDLVANGLMAAGADPDPAGAVLALNHRLRRALGEQPEDGQAAP